MDIATLLPFILFLSQYVSCLTANILFGFKTTDGAYMSGGSAVKHNGVTVTHDFNWIRKLDTCLIGMIGDISDCEEIFSAVERNCVLHGLDFDGRPLPVKSIAHLCQTLISHNIGRLNVNLLIAGWQHSGDALEGDPNASSGGVPKLYWIDNLAAIQDVSYGAHGPEVPFVLSMLDQHRLALRGETVAASLDSESTDAQSITVADPLLPSFVTKQCWNQLQKRSGGKVDVSTARLYCVDKKGARQVTLDT